MHDKHKNLLRRGFEEYLKQIESPLVPDDDYFSYNFSYIKSTKWNFLAESMIEDELRELTNKIHQWRDMLRQWQAWNSVAMHFNETDAWDLRREFTEPIIHYCLIKPSAIRDTFTFVATNVLHQIRLHTESGYKDHLEGEPTSAVPDPKPLSRKQKEARLVNLARNLHGSEKFLNNLRKLDDKEYQKSTTNYRNLNSHAIGPRIAIGTTKVVTRRIVDATKIESQQDGTYRVVKIPGVFVPSYSFGGIEPLDIESARNANLKQYLLSRICYDNFIKLLETHVSRLPQSEN